MIKHVCNSGNQQVKSWITFKKNHPELTSNLQTICPQPHTSSIIHRVFPVRDQHGRRVYIAQIVEV